MTRKIIKTMVGILMMAISGFVAFGGIGSIYIVDTLRGRGNYFTWVNDAIFAIFYTGGPVTDELMDMIHIANYVSAFALAAILSAVFTGGLMTVIFALKDKKDLA